MSAFATPASMRGAEVDDPLGEQVRVDVHDAVAARMLRTTFGIV